MEEVQSAISSSYNQNERGKSFLNTSNADIH